MHNIQNTRVLIESDWNLKLNPPVFSCWLQQCINRIRLEFKAIADPFECQQKEGINRIRLEFKVNNHRLKDKPTF